MDGMKGLPAFFQNNAKTVVEGLENFELGGDPADDALAGLIDEGDPLEDEDETFGGNIEYDESEDKLPEFFSTQRKPTAPVVPEQKIAQEFHQSVSINEPPRSLPPGLTPSKAPNAQYFASPNAFNSPPPAGLPQPHFGAPGLIGNTSSTPSGALLFGSSAYTAAAAGPGTPSVPPLGRRPSAAGETAVVDPPRTPASLFGNSLLGGNVTPREMSAATSVVTQALPQTPVHVGFTKPTEFLGRGKYMSASDVRYVVGRAMQPLETVDPYADDFYNIQYKIKKSRLAKEAALKENREPPEPAVVPVPTWKETKERIKQQMETHRRNFVSQVKEWEEKEQVLGHRIRAEVTKPKSLLSIPSPSDLMDFDLLDGAEDGLLTGNMSEWKSPFNSRLWSTRAAVQQGYEALFMVQELQELAQFPTIADNPIALEEIKREIESAINLLSQSLGIRTLAGTSPHHFHNGSGHTLSGASEYSLDGRHVSAILQTAIGKKLLIRGIKLLSPQHRWALIPIILARVLLPAPTTAVPPSSSSSAVTAAEQQQQQEYQQVERKLLQTISEYLHHCYNQHRDLHAKIIPGVAAPQLLANGYTKELVGHLRQCLKNIMITQMDKKAQLRESLLAEKTRAEVLYLVVQMGDQILTTWNDAQAKVEWVQTREAFMSLLES